MRALDPISLPLDRACLIEASAGTGKTYTMVNLYLRLLLGVGCSPLMVEQILVVTFTKAATQELRDRIREKVASVAGLFKAYHSGESTELENDPFLLSLYHAIQPRFYESLLRLQLAEREIDIAAIYTIDSFCQKMLFQFAFDSGVRFDLDLQADESALLTRLSQQSWRELFYPLGLAETAVVADTLKTPENALAQVQGYLYGELPPLSAEQQWLSRPLSEHLQAQEQFITRAKQHWRENGREVAELIWAELEKTYAKAEKKALSRSSYKKNNVENWLNQVHEWAESGEQALPPAFERFCQTMLAEKAEEGAVPLEHSLFAKNQAILTAWQNEFAGKERAILLYQFLQHLRTKLAEHKAAHPEKSFSDMLIFLHQALHSAQGEKLAAHIRGLFAFAMIDEFQDTNQVQYEIFQRIFLSPSEGNTRGFIMIGDPKQSIYKFRGADIFTYLKAAKHAAEKATLDRNWRSLPAVVEAVNRLFQFPEGAENSPFLYEGIHFQPVKSHTTDEQFRGEESVRLFLQSDFDDATCATQCAYQIQQQLKQAEAGRLSLQKNGENRPLAAKDIAVLVRSHQQAKLVRKALWARGIQSVFFSERDSVYESQEAQDLRFVLQACLSPYQQKAVLSALGTALWGLNAAEIYHLKQDEQAWDNCVAQFVHYQQVWQTQGVLPMLHQLFMHEGIIQRLSASDNADRRLTDLLHLAELLQSAMAGLENENALLRWYEQQLADPNGNTDEQKLRLESERELVKIITIHGSKGLEYPIVWLPFAGKASQGANSSGLQLYQENGELQWSLGNPSDSVQTALERAEFAEDLRLLYVAVTRAKYQLNLILPAQFEKGWSALGFLLSNGESGLSEAGLPQPTATYLAQKGIANIAAMILDAEIAEDDWRAAEPQNMALSAKRFEGKIRTKGQITSFSQLQARHSALQEFGSNRPLAGLNDEALDYDRHTEAPLLHEAQEDEFTPYHFPHSTKVGNLLHRLFEHSDFRQPIEEEKLLTLCEQLHLTEAWLEPLKTWLAQIIATPLPSGFCLAQISPQKRLNEWQFYLRLSNPKALPQLNQLLKQHSTLAKHLPDLQLSQVEGFVRGFVDCIVEVGGKFYVLDYKSNFLGNLPQDYSQERLAKTIGQYRYDLQYLLYTLALHRYLKSRKADYDYQRDFGGVAYLFLRGMNGETGSGVYFDKPSLALIDELDKLFQ